MKLSSSSSLTNMRGKRYLGKKSYGMTPFLVEDHPTDNYIFLGFGLIYILLSFVSQIP